LTLLDRLDFLIAAKNLPKQKIFSTEIYGPPETIEDVKRWVMEDEEKSLNFYDKAKIIMDRQLSLESPFTVYDNQCHHGLSKRLFGLCQLSFRRCFSTRATHIYVDAYSFDEFIALQVWDFKEAINFGQSSIFGLSVYTIEGIKSLVPQTNYYLPPNRNSIIIFCDENKNTIIGAYNEE
jgi:hypothetical protein